MCSADAARSQFPAVYTQNFSSATKYAVKVIQHDAEIPEADADAMPAQQGHYIMLVKGAPDILLKRSTHILEPVTGESLPLEPERMAKITAMQEEWSAKGQRVLLVARKQLPYTEAPEDSPAFADYVSRANNGLEVIGLLGIIDPPRSDIPEAIRICRAAGVRVFMVRKGFLAWRAWAMEDPAEFRLPVKQVTGDFKLTAAAIAEQCGIITNAKHIHG